MQMLALLLKLSAPIFLVVGTLHLVFGLAADVMLGAHIPDEVIRDPALDSQNRFYGVSFTLYGVLVYLCATDLEKYATVFRCVIGVFFAAGLARLVSIALYGVPPPLVVLLLVTELAVPPILALWHSRALAQGETRARSP